MEVWDAARTEMTVNLLPHAQAATYGRVYWELQQEMIYERELIIWRL